MELSIIIPTIRIANIGPSIRSICIKDNLKFNFEILIINNSQNLEEKFDLLNELKNFNIRYFHVKNQGSTEARHIGYVYSKSQILSFIDDDIIVSDSWLETIINTFKEKKEVSLIGGPSTPMTNSTNDILFLDSLKKNTIYDCGYINVWHSLIDLKKDIYDVNPDYVFSQNFSVRKNVFRECNYFNPDRYQDKNFELYGDGEFGFTQVFKKKNFLAYYLQKALVYHVIDRSRISKEYLMERSKIEGIVISFSDIRNNRKVNLFKLYSYIVIFHMAKIFFKFFDNKIKYFNKFYFIKYYIWHQKKVLKNKNLLDWINKKSYMIEEKDIIIKKFL
jgi:glucosyl-dolichyl phosphate glucuronosyltransferase